MIIGEAPAKDEVLAGVPFAPKGMSGRLLRGVLASFGIDPNDVWITNAVSCRNLAKTNPTDDEIERCRPRLFAEIEDVQPKVILALGNIALHSLVPSAPGITATHGHPITVDGLPTIIPALHPAAVLREPSNLFRQFTRDVGLTQVQLTPKLDLQYRVCENIDHVREMIEAIYRADGFVSVDLETTDLDPFVDDLMAIGFGTADDEAWIVPDCLAANDDVFQLLKNVLEDTSINWCGHNGRFDAQFLMSYGIKWSYDYDTMLAHYVLDEEPGHSLGILAIQELHVPEYKDEIKAMFRAHRAREIDRETQLYPYLARDCIYTRLLTDVLTAQMDDDDMFVFNEILMPADRAFADIEYNGAMLDRSYLMDEFRPELVARLETAQNQLIAMASSVGMPNFNPGSPKQVEEFLFGENVPEKTIRVKVPGEKRKYESQIVPAHKIGLWLKRPKGCPPGASKDAIEFVAAHVNHPALQLILDYRQIDRLIGTYVDGMIKRLDSRGKIHTDFNLFGTRTGRLSSSNPNLQNIPTVSEIGSRVKRAFIPSEPGWMIGEADESQVELRIAAHFSNDKTLVDAYHKGFDIHTLVASEIFHIPMEQVTKAQRYIAKYVDFGIVYGRGAKSLAEGELHCSIKEAESYLNRFWARFPGLKAWIAEQQALALQQGYVQSLFGRKRRFPLILPQNQGDIQRQAVNTPIQSSASDVTLTALTRIHNQLDPNIARILLTVHDSIVFEFDPAYQDEVLRLFYYEMVNNCPIQLNVPLDVEIKVGPSWGQVEHVSF